MRKTVFDLRLLWERSFPERSPCGVFPHKAPGPDDSPIADAGNGFLGFHRLSIMGLTPEGMQPFERAENEF